MDGLNLKWVLLLGCALMPACTGKAPSGPLTADVREDTGAQDAILDASVETSQVIDLGETFDDVADLAKGDDTIEIADLIEEEICIPGCDGKQCGPDGCGGLCGMCDDENPCTDDLCSIDQLCHFYANQHKCDDGDPCTAADQCEDGECVGGLDVCPCIQHQDCAAIEDGDLCNGTLVCDTTVFPYACKVDPSTVVKCDGAEDTDCTQTACLPGSGQCAPQNLPDGKLCDDGDLCTVSDSCKTGICTPGTNICQCHEDEDCVEYEDGNLCNGTLVCDTSFFPYHCQLALDTVVVCDPALGTDCALPQCVPETGLCALVPDKEGEPCGSEHYFCKMGACVCLGDCTGFECGDDGCGGSCGVCNEFPNSVCVDHACACTPDCAGHECGTDGCGASCGDCIDPWVCLEGNCVSGCPDQDPPCNGICVDYQTDPANCGQCGKKCLTTEPQLVGYCNSSLCASQLCPEGFWNPDGQPGNGCEYPCNVPGPESCNGGDDDCDGKIDEDFDLQNDLQNCGECSNICAPPNAAQFDCISGECRVLVCEPDYKDVNGNGADGCEVKYEPEGELWVDAWNIADPLADGSQDIPSTTSRRRWTPRSKGISYTFWPGCTPRAPSWTPRASPFAELLRKT